MLEDSSPGRRYGWFLIRAVLVCGFLAGLGFIPTKRMAGDEGNRAMLAGCGVSLVASALGALPLASMQVSSPAKAMTAVGAAMMVRLLLVVSLGLSAVLSGWFARGPLLIWIGISYLGLLIVDPRYALERASSGPTPQPRVEKSVTR